MDETREQLERLSSLLADHADRTFEAMDLVELAVMAELPAGGRMTAESFAELASTEAVHRRLRDKVAGLPQLDVLAFLDQNGTLINFSRYWPVLKMSARDRDYYRALSQPNGPDIYISRPVPSRITGEWMIYFTRRINSSNGDFLGVIVAAMGTKYLEQFFSGISSDPGSAISLVRSDGVLLARHPPLNGKLDEAALSGPALRSAGLRQFSKLTSVWDGQERFYATTRSLRYPLLSNVSVTVASAFERLKRLTWFAVVSAALLELGILAVAIVGAKELRGRLRLSQERAEKGQLIAEAELALARERETAAEERAARDRRFRVAIETMRQGLCMFDGDERLVIFNHRVAADLGIPVERLSPGLPLRALIALMEEHGTIDADGAARFRQSLSLSHSTPNNRTTIETLLDGRILSYAVRPMAQDAGWVLTCEDVTDRHRAEQRLLHISLHDPLTDLANRTTLRHRIEAEARETQADESGSAVLYVDLDGFKEVNDTLGHPAGDAVLQEVAARLLKCTRNADTVARIGGDEFVIVQARAAHPGSAAALAERLIAELQRPFDVAGHHIVLGASLGIAFVQPGDVEPDLCIKRADLALYEAKKDGGNCCRIFEPRLETAALARSKLCAELKEAVENQEFVVHYQPLVTVRTRALCGFEALVRWVHPTRGLVPPGEFIQVAEEIGLIHQIGEQVLFQACAEATAWPPSIKIAVNLSPKQFGHDRHIAETVREALTWSGLDPGRLELEITESILLQGTEEMVGILYEFKELGVRIAMDDFGTGYSSLSYLQKFPFDKIKIDQSFVHNMVAGETGEPIIHTIMALCKIIGLRTTAEGVETEMQFDLLSREGCDEAQGFLFGRPTPPDEIGGVIERLLHQVEEVSL